MLYMDNASCFWGTALQSLSLQYMYWPKTENGFMCSVRSIGFGLWGSGCTVDVLLIRRVFAGGRGEGKGGVDFRCDYTRL